LACVFHIVSSFVFINYSIIIIIIIIIIVFVCNKETVITGNLHHRNRPKPPTTTESHLTNPPATPNQAVDLANREKKKKIEKKTGLWRSRINLNPRPTASPRHTAPPRPVQTHQKFSKTHCKQPPWRSQRERESVLTSPRNFRCHHRRIASPLSLPLSSHRLASVVTASIIIASPHLTAPRHTSLFIV
jgi:hypothetical protein